MKNGPQSVGQILAGFNPLQDKYVSREFQKYAYDLATELNDLGHRSLYMKLAKETPRAVLEKARSFVKDAKARSKAKLFMWKLRELGAIGQKGKKAIVSRGLLDKSGKPD